MAMNKALLAGAATIVLGALGLWYALESGTGTKPEVPRAIDAPADPGPSAPPVPPPAIAHPLPAAASAAGDTGLPVMEQSDAALLAALAPAIGAGAVRDYLEPENLIRRLVVTVDNIPRQKIPVGRRPLRRLGAPFHAEGDELHATLDPQNYQRYAPYVAVVRNLDVAALMKVYVAFYPLVQHAYQDLGYPNGYFNDRLVEAIDVLLATPQLTGPVDLVRPNVMYEFADPALESRPAGQKLMLRLGPENASEIKAKLTELRSALTAASPR
jgi:hypothetical protein